MASLQGSFLVASPHLTDSNFMRSVVLIIRHDEDGAFGLVLNRPTHNTFSEVWEAISDTPCKSGEVIHIGGPVGGPLIALHAQDSVGEEPVMDGVILASQRETLQQLADGEFFPLRFFTGYSGWAPGQLEAELEQGGWLVAPASGDQVFSDPQDLWKEVMHEIGQEIISSRVAGPFPSDPSVN